MKKGYILVFTTSSAFEAEMLLKADFSVKLVPTPREFSSDCGIAVEFSADSDGVKRICEILDSVKMEYEIKLI